VSAPAGLRLRELSVDDGRWRAFLERSPDATPFHHPSWALALADAYRFGPLVLALVDRSGRVAAGLPAVRLSTRPGVHRLVSLPFTDRCAPLGPAEVRRALVEATVRHAAATGAGRVEIRDAVAAAGGLAGRPAGVWHALDLRDGADAVLARQAPSHRRNERRAVRAGVRIRAGFAPGDLERFYRLHVATRRRLGVPVQPLRFFRAVHRRLAGEELAFVLTAERGGEPVAASLFLAWNGVLVYKWGASDAAAWRDRPNNLLLCEAIRTGARLGCHTLDWGRSETAQSGLRAFKAGFGAAEHELAWSFSPPAPSPRSPHAEAVLAAVIRHSPALVCRAIGASLYRFAA
jgi:hypothetical protein